MGAKNSAASDPSSWGGRALISGLPRSASI